MECLRQNDHNYSLNNLQNCEIIKKSCGRILSLLKYLHSAQQFTHQSTLIREYLSEYTSIYTSKYTSKETLKQQHKLKSQVWIKKARKC